MSASEPAVPATVLVVDDEAALAGLVCTYLERAGYATLRAETGPEALRLARDAAPDVIVLDLGLPGMDGVEVCRQVRTFSDCYVVMLTARTEETDRLIGLSVGADDYVTKPFSPRELVARVQVMLRRPRTGRAVPAPEELPPRVFGDLRIEPGPRLVSVAGRDVDLTRTEFDLLAALSARPRFAWARRQLIDEVWDRDWVGDEHLVDVHVAHLRRKLGDDPVAPRYVETVRGVGYRMGSG
ncbi:response regulator transcription factor [uncultured Phycicoccus sp.]|uniref:response regulator transcription factor n=1 Tax=uncultured Phycicoccus sp. TaxID=661422 RepID=UPI0026253EC6|nr:response regulator transcription factor [uncultured Phycicoccus sp.]